MAAAHGPRPLTLAIPHLTPVPATTSSAELRRTDLRRVYHFHTVPSPPRFLPWNDPSWTGDHYAISRYASALSLQFDHLARVIGILPAHLFLGGAVGVLFWFGTRQSIHTLVLGCRNMARLRAERAMIEEAREALGATPLFLENLSHRNHMQKLQTGYYMVLDTSSGVGATLIGVGTLFRGPLLGGLSHGLIHLALPIAVGGFFPLVVPTAIGLIDRTVRVVRAAVRVHDMRKHLEALQGEGQAGVGVGVGVGVDIGFDADVVAQVQSLYRHRQGELTRFFIIDWVARAGLLAGAATSVFVGPGGLLLLVPSTLAVLTMECFSRRIVNVDDTLPLEERMHLQTDEDFFAAITHQHLDLQTLKSLRQQRLNAYPNGWGTVWRPLYRLIRHLRGVCEPDPALSKEVLGAFANRSGYIVDWPQPTPHELMDLIDQGRVRLQFAASILKSRRLRGAFLGRGFSCERRKWSLDADVLAETLEVIQADPDGNQTLVDSVYEKAEEVLLNTGLTEAYRRERALLDHYGRYVQTAARLATTRRDS